MFEERCSEFCNSHLRKQKGGGSLKIQSKRLSFEIDPRYLIGINRAVTLPTIFYANICDKFKASVTVLSFVLGGTQNERKVVVVNNTVQSTVGVTQALRHSPGRYFIRSGDRTIGMSYFHFFSLHLRSILSLFSV